ncbi:hypothetical protein [Paracoccus laeviglucosivorans]|uniref:hypothetical protein n=1 Tax=Paracoccus laeviglucosivorans TaxID=1197861 RepID=UPI00115BB5DC|nr:hypothetical protein [Paracoccus laeviglucosivorans]
MPEPAAFLPDTDLKPALLIFTYGQSNADGFVTAGRPQSPLLENPEVLTPSASNAREVSGQRKQARQVFWQDGRRLRPEHLQRIMPTAWRAIGSTSILHVAGSVLMASGGYDGIYVQSAAKGGMRLVGLPPPHQYLTGIFRLADGSVSPILQDMLDDAAELLAAARANGRDASRCYILFIHGEADRATPVDAYVEAFHQAKTMIDESLIRLGCRPHWLVTQIAGTTGEFSGNDWHSRQAILRIAQQGGANLTFLGPLYPYSLQDSIHHGPEGKTLIGELSALAISALEAGQAWHAPRPLSWRRLDDRRIQIDVFADGPLMTDHDAPAYPNFGFSLPARIPNRISDVALTGPDRIVVELESPARGGLVLDYAFRRSDPASRGEPRPLPFGGGQIRTGFSSPSRIYPGKHLHHWLPGFRLAIPPGQAAGPFTP